MDYYVTLSTRDPTGDPQPGEASTAAVPSVSLVITTLKLPPVAVVSAAGEVDLATAGDLERAVVDAVRAGCLQVSLDLARVSFLDCSGLRGVLGAHQQLARLGGRLRIVALSPAVERVLVPGDLRRLLTVAGLAAS